MTYLYLFLSSVVFICMRAFQQLNVQHERYLWVPPVTAMMAMCEVLTVTAIIKVANLTAVIPLTLGGVLGCWFAMWFHKKMRERSK